MRVTQQMLGSVLTSDLQSVQSQMLHVQQQLATGRRILVPSNDPVGTQNVLQWQGAMAQNKQFQANASNAVDWLQSTDTALQSAVSVAQQVRTLAVSTGSAALTASEDQTIANQISSLQSSLVQIGNTKVGDHYLFNGDQTATAPFTQSGNSVTFAGGTGAQMREVAPGSSIQANTGGGVFMPVFGAITQILQDLKSPSTVGNVTSGDLAALDAAIGNLSNADGQVGASLQQAQQAQSMLTDLNQSLQTLEAGTLDTNMAKAVVQLQELQVGYQSALAVGGRLMEPTLAHYLQ